MLAPLGIERVPSKYENWAAWQRPGEAPKLWVGFPYNRLPANWATPYIAAAEASGAVGVDTVVAGASFALGRAGKRRPKHRLSCST